MEKGGEMSVSIIVPVYQAKGTLRECVLSCLSQKCDKLDDMEVILVDDGSTDGSGELCDELSGEDKRIKVLHTENHGVSHARNTGMDEATGKYIVFVDSDDLVKEGFLENVLKYADEGTVLVDETDSFTAEENISGFQYIENSILNKNSHVWGKLFLLDAIRKDNIRFLEGLTIGEDLLFMLDVAISQGKKRAVRCISGGDYIYRENEQGAMKRAFKESYLDEIRCWRMAEEKLLPYGREISAYALVSVAVSQILTAFLVAGKISLIEEGKIDKTLQERAMGEVEEQIRHALKTRGTFAALPTGHKIKTLLFRFNKNLYLKMYGSHKRGR